MARPGVTYSEIAEAAAHLVGQGKNPTIEQIRLFLGTGSSTTIANHLKEWKEQQQGTSLLAAKENIPQELIEMVKGLWERVIGQAQEKISLVENNFEKTKAELQQELSKYKTNNQRWQQLFNQWQSEKEKLNTDKLTLDRTVISLQQDISVLDTKLESQVQQVQEKQDRIAELNRLHKLAQENLEHYRESSRVQRLIDQEKHTQQLMQLNNEITIVKDQLEKIRNENVSLMNVRDVININLDQLTSEYHFLEREKNEINREAKHWQLQHDIAVKKLTTQGNDLIEQQKQYAVMSQQLSTAISEVKELKEQNQLLTREKWEIAQENTRLESVNKQMQEMIYAKEVV